MKNYFNIISNLGKIPSFYIPLLISLLFNVLIWIIILWRLPATVSWIPLHFNTYFGIDWIGPWIQIFIYPFIALLIIIANLIISIIIFNKVKYLTIVLNYISLITQIIILMGLITLLIKYFV